MKRLIPILLLFALIAPAKADDAEKLAKFEAFLTEFRVEKVIPSLSVAIIRDQQVIYTAALGWQDDEGELPTHKDTTYNIASVTKPMAAVAILRAVEQGLISLDAPLSSSVGWDGFCGWFPSSGIIFAGATLEGEVIPPFDCAQPMTLRDGLNHRVNGVPGTTFAYNPLVYARLGRLFPTLTDTTFYNVLRENVIEPAGMENTAAGWRDLKGSSALTHLTPPFKVDEDGNLEKNVFPDDDIRAAAGIKTSVTDMAKFDIALDQGKLLTPEIMKKMWTPDLDANGQPFPYTLGWFYQNYQGLDLYWHSGWQPDSYSALYLKVPEKNITIIAFANTEGIWWGNPITRAEVEESTLAAKFLELFVGVE